MTDETRQVSIRRRTVLGGLLGVTATGLRAQGSANSDAMRSIIVPFAAGGVVDTLGRKIADSLRPGLGKTFLVENFPGAGGVIAANQVLKRPANGRTLLLGNSGLIVNTPLLSKTPLGFDPQNDFVPVCTLVNIPFMVFCAKDYAASDLKGLQRLGESRKESLLFATQMVGTANHIAGEVLLQRLGIRGTHVPYKDTNQLVIDVAEGRVPIGITNWADLSAFLAVDKVKALGFLSDTPSPLAPDVPTVMSQGFGSFDIQGWIGLFLAKGVPDRIALEYEDGIKTLFRNPGFVNFMMSAGLVPVFRGRDDSRVFIQNEIQRYKQLLHKYNIVEA